jgi:hypothetical protein
LRETYSTPFLRVWPGKSTGTLEFLLVHGHVLIFPGLKRLALRHLLRQRLFLVHHGRPYPDQSILVPAL